MCCKSSRVEVFKTPSNSEKIRQNLDLEPGTWNEFNNPTRGMWLIPKHPKDCCIYRVPTSIRQVNPEAYTPQLLIIGPLHHSLKCQAIDSSGDVTNAKSIDYLNMEQHKKIYVAEFEQRLKSEQTIDGLRGIIEEHEDVIRASYSESTAWIQSPQFVDMILHDSVFIIEFILRTSYATREKTGDPLVDEPCLTTTIKEDLILLENQLPYFLLEKLFDPIAPKLSQNKTFCELVVTYFLDRKIKYTEFRDTEFRHFTDLVRLVRVKTLPEIYLREYERPIELTYCADKLDSGGVEFEVVKEDFSLNVRFENGCLKIPCLKVDDKVEMRLRNVMALEQCHYPYKAFVCNYVMFLDHLIDTHKDVEVLVEKGIIKNWIGEDDSVAKMVNKLCLGIIEIGSHYSDIADEVNAYYKNPLNKSRAILKRVYFGNLWTGTATVAAIFLLIMTLIQTVASIIQIMQ